MRKVDLMIIGAQKAGTTSLKNYLAQHPQVVSHFQTEFTYFNDKEIHSKGFDAAYKQFIDNDDDQEEKKLVVKYAGLYAHEDALKALYEHNPEVKLVLILRNPIERAYSAYNMEKTFSSDWMDTDFDGMIELFKNKEINHPMYKLFIRMGMYANYVEKIYSIFPKAQLKIILFEELNKNTDSVCTDVFRWLNIDDNFIPNTSVIHNKTAKPKNKMAGKIIKKLRSNSNPLKQLIKTFVPQKTFSKLGDMVIEMNKSKSKIIPPIQPQTREQYVSLFKPDILKLEALTGKDFSIWLNKK